MADLPPEGRFPTSPEHPEARVDYVCPHCNEARTEVHVRGLGGGRSPDGAMLWRTDKATAWCDNCHKPVTVPLPQPPATGQPVGPPADKLPESKILKGAREVLERVRPEEAAIRKKAGFEPFGGKKTAEYARRWRQAVHADKLYDPGAQSEIAFLLEQLDMERHASHVDVDEDTLKGDCLRIAMQALHQIATFDHVGGPECCDAAPVYECGCWDESVRDIAVRARERIEALCNPKEPE